jgi:hypothetical protein
MNKESRIRSPGKEVGMRQHRARLYALTVVLGLLTSCMLPGLATPTALPTPTLLLPSPVPVSPTALAVASATQPGFPTLAGSTLPAATQAAVTQGATQMPPAAFCADVQPSSLINNFKSALLSSNGPLLASLISPTHGMDARLYRDGRVVNYDQAHAKFLFDSTYAVDWGVAPASGLDTKGPFHETILPALLDVFQKTYALTCNQVQVGGTTYQATWPYPGINFYSAYYAGTQANANMDWHTWLLGMHYLNGKPYLYAIMQFQWEP